jgi:hypothetical protein
MRRILWVVPALFALQATPFLIGGAIMRAENMGNKWFPYGAFATSKPVASDSSCFAVFDRG